MITFNDIKETEIPGLFLSDRKIYAPPKKKIKVEIPFMSGSYDFSTVGSDEDIVYGDRVIECKFGIKSKSKAELQVRYKQFLNWLYDIGRCKLMFDDLREVYFLGEIEKEPNWREIVVYGETTVTFVCEPFKYGKEYEGADVWDTFNFETDYSQVTVFNVSGSKNVSIYNPGKNVIPDVIVSADMSCTLNGYTASFTTNKTKDYYFKLLSGFNSINIKGTGTIDFKFRKKVI
ncbi:phage tail protein [Clostridium sporogenes]|uniref:distal tail protein Dit n=1 Tax=Clostridium sporogenes TaxID=1509 RepID=UPI00077FF159|nr:distal tail protein Dit [Clostridium sporogenes]KYN77184.1 phage tail protein [Clostridium sporogenes]